MSTEGDDPDVLVLESRASRNKEAEKMCHDLASIFSQFYLKKMKVKPTEWVFDFLESYDGNTYFL